MSGFNGTAFKGLTEADILNNLTSTATDKPGSANMLKTLNDYIATLDSEVNANASVGTYGSLSNAAAQFRGKASFVSFACAGTKFSDLPSSSSEYGSGILTTNSYYQQVVYFEYDGDRNIYIGQKINSDSSFRWRKISTTSI